MRFPDLHSGKRVTSTIGLITFVSSTKLRLINARLTPGSQIVMPTGRNWFLSVRVSLIMLCPVNLVFFYDAYHILYSLDLR